MFSNLQYQDWLGYLAACLTTGSFVPQALLTLRTRDVSGISLSMYSAFTLGVALWLVYGLLLQAWPVVAATRIRPARSSLRHIAESTSGSNAASPAAKSPAVAGSGTGTRLTP